MQVTLDLPEKFALDFSSTELGQRIKLDAALTMFQSGSLSAGAACEFAGVDRFIFIAECKKHNIPYIQENVFKRFRKMTDICVGNTSMPMVEEFPREGRETMSG